MDHTFIFKSGSVKEGGRKTFCWSKQTNHFGNNDYSSCIDEILIVRPFLSNQRQYNLFLIALNCLLCNFNLESNTAQQYRYMLKLTLHINVLFVGKEKKNQVFPDIVIKYLFLLSSKTSFGFADDTEVLCNHKINTKIKQNKLANVLAFCFRLITFWAHFYVTNSLG